MPLLPMCTHSKKKKEKKSVGFSLLVSLDPVRAVTDRSGQHDTSSFKGATTRVKKSRRKKIETTVKLSSSSSSSPYGNLPDVDE